MLTKTSIKQSLVAVRNSGTRVGNGLPARLAPCILAVLFRPDSPLKFVLGCFALDRGFFANFRYTQNRFIKPCYRAKCILPSIRNTTPAPMVNLLNRKGLVSFLLEKLANLCQPKAGDRLFNVVYMIHAKQYKRIVYLSQTYCLFLLRGN